jgi:hypothetical protein
MLHYLVWLVTIVDMLSEFAARRIQPQEPAPLNS